MMNNDDNNKAPTRVATATAGPLSRPADLHSDFFRRRRSSPSASSPFLNRRPSAAAGLLDGRNQQQEEDDDDDDEEEEEDLRQGVWCHIIFCNKNALK